MRSHVIAAAAAFCLAAAAPAAAAPPGVGQVSLRNSGAPAAQEPFLRGLALLHNFEYSSAAEAFRAAQAADPGFALAYWGEAMTHNHPVWMVQDAAAARAILQRLAPTRDARLAKAATPRERDWLDAVETLYGAGSKEERDRLYSAKMAALHAADPADVDARAFYALSLLGLAHQGRDIPLYMRSAALLEEAYPANPDHPGVLHYLIHSYDDPAHAPLGLRAARRYGAIAPEAGHALHMTSHIFLAMGMWREVEQANVQAIAVVNGQRAAAGKPAVACGHYPEWQVYARLQLGRTAEADKDIAACRAAADRALAGAQSTSAIEAAPAPTFSWADMAVRRLVDTGRWDAGNVPPLPDGRYLLTRFTLAYGALLDARGELPRVRRAGAELATLAAALAEARKAEGAGPVEHARREAVILRQAAGLEKLAAGDAAGGLAELRAAAEAEAAMPVGFGPPLVEKPSRELLADALLALGRKEEAAAEYRLALAATPGRRRILDGLAKAGAPAASAAPAAR